MHELGIMESALGLVQRCAAERNARRVERVVLRIGTLSGVDPDSLRFAFEVVSRGTSAEGADLDIESVPATAYCKGCQEEFTATAADFVLRCPNCSVLCGDVRRGREIELSRLEFT